MKTLEEIRKDLLQIRFYQKHKAVMDLAIKSVGNNQVLDLVNKYNALMTSAPAKLFSIYAFLYIEGYSQEEAAEKLYYSPQYVQRMNVRLLHFLQDRLKEEA